MFISIDYVTKLKKIHTETSQSKAPGRKTDNTMTRLMNKRVIFGPFSIFQMSTSSFQMEKLLRLTDNRKSLQVRLANNKQKSHNTHTVAKSAKVLAVSGRRRQTFSSFQLESGSNWD